MRYLQAIFRILRYAILVALALIVGAVAVFTLTEKGRENLAGLISGVASNADSKLTIGGIDGIWTGALTVDHVVLADREGAWLALRGIEIDWSPLALLSLTFKAEKIHADRIELARLPKGPEKTEEGGKTTLPVSLAINQLDLPEIALGPELAGGIAEISARGSLHADAQLSHIESDIDVARTDGRGGRLTAKVAFDPAENRLDIDVKGSEPAGGILANLLKLPDAPPVAVAVTGSGPAADWSGGATFAVDGVVITRLSGTHQFVGTDSRIEAKGDGEFERFLPEAFRPLLSGKTVFDIAGTRSVAGGIAVERANLESNTLRGTAKGTLDPEGASDFALDVEATGNAVTLALGSEASPVSIALRKASVRALGAGDAPAVDIGVTLQSVDAGMAVLQNVDAKLHSDAFDIASRTGPLTLLATAGGATSSNANLAPLLAGALNAQVAAAIAAGEIRIESGSVTNDALSASLAGSVSREDGSLAFDLKADVATTALPAAARTPLGEKAAIAVKIARDAEGNITADDLSLASGGFSASGNAGLAGGAINAELKGALADIGAVAKDAKGAVDFAVTAAGNQAAPEISLTFSSDRIEAAGREITGLELAASGTADLANPAADLRLKGNVAGQALEGSAVLKTIDGKREINGLSIALGQNRITGDLTLDEAFTPLGTIALTLPDIGPLAALALDKAEGAIEGNIRFSKKGAVPEVAVNANAAMVQRGDLSVQSLAIDAVVDDYLAAPGVSGTVRAAAVNSGTTVIRDVNVSLRRDGLWTGFSGGATVSDIPATATGRARSAGGTTTIELSAAEATVRGNRAVLSRPTTIVIKGGETTLDRLALAVAGGAVDVTGSVGQALNLDVQIARLPATVVNAFAPGLDLGGLISGTARLSGAPASPNVGYTIDWSSAATAQTRSAGFGAMNIRSSGALNGGVLKFDVTAADSAGLNLTGGGTVNTAGARALALDFSGAVPFSFLTQRLAAQGLSLTGGSNVSLQIRGNAGAPVIGGTIRSSGGRFVDVRSGIAINDINAEIAIGNGVANITRLTGTLSSGGTLSAGGTIGIDAARGFPADLSVKIVNGRYTDGRVVTANLSGDIALKGPLVSAPVLSGNINLGKTVITVPEKLPGSLTALDVKHRNATAAVRAQDKAIRPDAGGGGGGSGLTLDINVSAPQAIFVQGRGLDAELGGTLRLTGPLASPQAIGQFTMRRGRLSILGKRLTFTRGTLGFSGSLVPTLDMAAESSAGDATVTIAVTGLATNPKFTFSSVPALPEDEVLARLIFGRSMSNLSPLQIAQLAEAAAQLAGVGGSTSLLQDLRGKLGVDDLDIKTDEKTGSTSVSAGKYLNDRTYVTIEKGDRAGSGKATIDLNVGRGVKLRGEARDDGEARGGIFYEREY